MGPKQILIATIAVVLSVGTALAQCDVRSLERFLDKRAFELSADQKIELYADRLVRYYGKQNVTRNSVYRSMVAWEKRWPERIYKFIRVTDFKETDEALVTLAGQLAGLNLHHDGLVALIGFDVETPAIGAGFLQLEQVHLAAGSELAAVDYGAAIGFHQLEPAVVHVVGDVVANLAFELGLLRGSGRAN